ncbi:MAG: TraR/DksA C4-type zinc finger protein [Dehalococcoidales bacterium]|nr:TraR/DksA C4-type zinc finger protein [Dehalococcoidales bacterium]
MVNLELLRTHLESERERLTREVEQLAANVRSTDEQREGSPFGKREEEASETSELETRLALEKRIKDKLAKVTSALAKFDQGTYGLCEICGQPIDPERLEALPEATLCLKCKASQSENAKGK